ncbi:MAG: hypothetical protein MUC43_14135 [Pirellula sp.]|nr:hypothetical protein [Pirellula sp.]
MTLPGSISNIRFSERDSTGSAFCIPYWLIVYWLAPIVLCSQIASDANAMSSRIPVVFHYRTITSASGDYELSIDPSNQSGEGESDLKLTKNGELLWAKKFPATFYEAFISNDGRIVGYAYTNGVQGGVDPGKIAIFILAVDGEILLDERIARSPSPYFHMDPTPIVGEFVAAQGTDLVAVLIRGVWRFYSLSEARLFRSLQADDKGVWKAVWVRDTEYLVVQSCVGRNVTDGVCYRIIDTNGAELFRLEWLDDFQCKDHKKTVQLVEHLHAHGSVKYGPKSRTFALESFANQTLVTYEIIDTSEKFDVRSISTIPTVMPPSNDTKLWSHLPGISLQPKETIRVSPTPGKFRNVIPDLDCGFVFGPGRKLLVARREQRVRDAMNLGSLELGDSEHMRAPVGWIDEKRILVEGSDEYNIVDSQSLNILKRIDRKSDHTWLNMPRGACLGPNGEIAFTSRKDRYSNPPHLYSSEGEPIRTIAISSEVNVQGMEYDGSKWFLTEGDQLYVLNADGELLARYTLKLNPSWFRIYTQPSRRLGTDELYLMDRNNKYLLYRFEIPLLTLYANGVDQHSPG